MIDKIKLKKCPYCGREEEYEDEFEGNWGHIDCCYPCAAELRDKVLNNASRKALWKYVCSWEPYKKKFLDYYMDWFSKYEIAEFIFTNNLVVDPLQHYDTVCKDNLSMLRTFIANEETTHDIGLMTVAGEFDDDE